MGGALQIVGGLENSRAGSEFQLILFLLRGTFHEGPWNPHY